VTLGQGWLASSRLVIAAALRSGARIGLKLVTSYKRARSRIWWSNCPPSLPRTDCQSRTSAVGTATLSSQNNNGEKGERQDRGAHIQHTHSAPPLEEPHHAKHTSNTWRRRPVIVVDPPILPCLAALCWVSRRTAASTRSRPMPNTARSFRATRRCCRCARSGHGPCRVLRDGHAARILVERVEKPTDKRPTQRFCYSKWLILILRKRSA
jgi:hypothetical protein